MLVGYATIRWRGHLFDQLLRQEVVKRLDESAQLVQQTAQANIATPYPPPSLPGEFPHLRSADLQASVQYVVDNGRLIAVIGSKLPKKYGLYLEIGTRKMAPRPWLRPSLAACIPQIQQIFGRTLNGASGSFRDVSTRSIILYRIGRALGLGG